MLEKVLNERYKIIKELGKGGMAIVYEAQDLLLDRKVALKMLRPEYVNDTDFVRRFRHEAKAVARLSHPNVVNIFDIGQEDKYHYLVMEDIEGRNLKDIIKEKGKLEIIEALDIARQICSALVIAHKNNIIHCDIKPHNILITPDKQVKVTDFGIARAVTSSTMTITDTIVGSAHYFSPEQARGGEIKTRSDLYSLGIVLYEMLTGEVPFKGDSPISVALKHIQETPKRPSLINPEIIPAVEKLVMKAIAKDPEARFSNAGEMRESISKVIEELRTRKVDKAVTRKADETLVMKKVNIQSEKTKPDTQRKYLTQNVENRALPLWVKWTLGISFVALIAIVGIFIFYQAYMDVPIVEVPDVIGMDYEEAKEEASLVGLELEKQNEGVHHPEIPEGKIISQYPVGGERVRQTRKIMVTISKGPAVLTVPDLTNLTIREAQVILDNHNLTIGEKEFQYSDQIEKDRIISQQPEPGEEIGLETQINLVISNGPQPNMVRVPNLIGLSQEEAVDLLTENKLTVGEITEEPTKRFLAGQVSSQEFEPGTEVPENSKVNLTISSGLINSEGARVHSAKLNVYVPPGSSNQQIRVVIIDNNGRDILYEGTHRPDTYIPVYFNSVGTTRFEIYVNDKLWEVYDLG
jgi:serine/threonine-protein kinase